MPQVRNIHVDELQRAFARFYAQIAADGDDVHWYCFSASNERDRLRLSARGDRPLPPEPPPTDPRLIPQGPIDGGYWLEDTAEFARTYTRKV